MHFITFVIFRKNGALAPCDTGGPTGHHGCYKFLRRQRPTRTTALTTAVTMDDRSEIVGLIQANFAGFADGDVGAMRSVDHVDATIWEGFAPGQIPGAQARAAFRKSYG